MFFKFLPALLVAVALVVPPCYAQPSEDKIKEDLMTFVYVYVAGNNKNTKINRKNPNVIKRGKEFVATFTEIAPETAYATMKKSNSKYFDYIATLRYEERTYESKGKTKKEALAGEFRCVKSRSLIELPRYAKGKWEN